MGLEVSPTAAFAWGSRAPLRCHFFAWLAFKNRCWTSAGLARRGLPHQDSCPLCGEAEESIQHLLLDCVFARQIWHWVGRITDRTTYEPLVDEELGSWCTRQDLVLQNHKARRAICFLVMWMLWKHRNDVVLNGTFSSIPCLKQRIREEGVACTKVGLLGKLAQEEAVDRWTAQE